MMYVKRSYKLLIYMIFISMLLQGCSYPKNISIDEEYDKQWYLMEERKNINIIGEIDIDGFITENISFDSSINLGVWDFWESNVNKEKKLVIAMIDSKVDTKHEDLSSHIWKNKGEIPDNKIDDDKNGFIDDYEGWNFYSNSNNVSSINMESNHGTHCAGIIASAHNGIGTMGIIGNTNVELMILPVYENVNEKVLYNNVCSAIRYANMMGADICNIPSACIEGKREFENVIRESDMCFIVAAGNYKNSYFSALNLDKYPRYPACVNSEKVITVGSVDSYGIKSVFSNYSKKYVDLFAPGEYIYSTLPNNNYGYESGTSMSTSIVTSIIGIYYYKGHSIEDSIDIVLENCNQNVVKFSN